MFSESGRIYKNEQPYIAIRKVVAQKNIPQVLPPLVDEVAKWMTEHNISPAGDMFFHYLSMDADNNCIAEAGFPVKEIPLLSDGITGGSFPEGHYASITYTGDYKFMMDAHTALESYINAAGYKEETNLGASSARHGSRAEFYLNDCAEIPDPAKWITRIDVLLQKEPSQIIG